MIGADMPVSLYQEIIKIIILWLKLKFSHLPSLDGLEYIKFDFLKSRCALWDLEAFGVLEG